MIVQNHFQIFSAKIHIFYVLKTGNPNLKKKSKKAKSPKIKKIRKIQKLRKSGTRQKIRKFETLRLAKNSKEDETFVKSINSGKL